MLNFPADFDGAFFIGRELFESARRQKARLESGAVRYSTLNCCLRPDAVNCQAAVALCGSRPLLVTLPDGAAANRAIQRAWRFR